MERHLQNQRERSGLRSMVAAVTSTLKYYQNIVKVGRKKFKEKGFLFWR